PPLFEGVKFWLRDQPAEFAPLLRPPVPATPVWAMTVHALALVGKIQASTVKGPLGKETRLSVKGTARKLPFTPRKLTEGSASEMIAPGLPRTKFVLE